MLYARIGMGIEIELDLDPIRKNSEGMSTKHYALGKIHYGGGETGQLLEGRANDALQRYWDLASAKSFRIDV